MKKSQSLETAANLRQAAPITLHATEIMAHSEPLLQKQSTHSSVPMSAPFPLGCGCFPQVSVRSLGLAGSCSSSCHLGSHGDPLLPSVFSVPQGTCEARCSPGPSPSLETCEVASGKKSFFVCVHIQVAVCAHVLNCPIQQGSVLPLAPDLGREKPVTVINYICTGIKLCVTVII